MPDNPVISMIIPGRRAFGETWSEVHIIPDSETQQYRVERADTDAPEDNVPIFVPGLGNASIEMANFILGEQRERAKDRAKRPKEDVTKEINRMWQDYAEQRLRWGRGQTALGPGGFFQRERM